MTAPERSLLQRQTALGKANDVRFKRAQLKIDLKAGRLDIPELIREPPDWLETMKIVDFLLAIPKTGRVKARKTLNLCYVSPSKTIGGLSDRQRQELMSALR